MKIFLAMVLGFLALAMASGFKSGSLVQLADGGGPAIWVGSKAVKIDPDKCLPFTAYDSTIPGYSRQKDCAASDGSVDDVDPTVEPVPSTDEPPVINTGHIKVRGLAGAMPCGCATRGQSTCLWSPDGGIPFPGPPATTFAPGTFSGVSCINKACVELLGRPSMPPACQ